MNLQGETIMSWAVVQFRQEVFGKSPLGYFQSLRVERAVHLLKTGKASVDEIAARVGYRDGATLRSLLRRRLNVGVKEIRKR